MRNESQQGAKGRLAGGGRCSETQYATPEQHQPHILSVLVLASYSGVAIMTPPAPALAALLLSGFAFFACLGMLAVTLQREIDVEVGSGASAFLDVFTWHLARWRACRRWRRGSETWRLSMTTSLRRIRRFINFPLLTSRWLSTR